MLISPSVSRNLNPTLEKYLAPRPGQHVPVLRGGPATAVTVACTSLRRLTQAGLASLAASGRVRLSTKSLATAVTVACTSLRRLTQAQGLASLAASGRVRLTRSTKSESVKGRRPLPCQWQCSSSDATVLVSMKCQCRY